MINAFPNTPWTSIIYHPIDPYIDTTPMYELICRTQMAAPRVWDWVDSNPLSPPPLRVSSSPPSGGPHLFHQLRRGDFDDLLHRAVDQALLVSAWSAVWDRAIRSNAFMPLLCPRVVVRSLGRPARSSSVCQVPQNATARVDKHDQTPNGARCQKKSLRETYL